MRSLFSTMLFFFLLVAELVQSELFSDSRDGHDTNSFRKNARLVIQDVDLDGQTFLLRYGYLKNCMPTKLSRKRRFVSFNLLEQSADVIKTDKTTIPPCTKENVVEAVKRLQSHYGMSPTGLLDVKTVELMNQGRCGVGDSSESLKKEDKKIRDTHSEEPGLSADRVSRQRRSLNFLHFFDTATLYTSAKETHIRRKKQVLAEMGPMKVRQHRRRRRMITSNASAGTGRFAKQRITWRLLPQAESRRIPDYLQRYYLQLAFRMWSEVTPLYYVEDNQSAEHYIDILISFGTRAHENCAHDFDGAGGEIAHSKTTGPVHVDDDENFEMTGTVGVDILRVFVHEIGHSLGLKHIFNPKSIMYPVNVNRKQGSFELANEERRAVQNLYGKCTICIDLVFDWLRNDLNGYPTYNTYIFSRGVYWMYENKQERPRYGDPKQVIVEWRGLPAKVDAVFQMMDIQSFTYLTYFFSGCKYYKYDEKRSEVMPGFPRNITDDFGSSVNGQAGIPCNIDSAFYDYRIRNIMFFKNDKVYFYDPGSVEAFHTNNCCDQEHKIEDIFPVAPGNKTLATPISSVYLHVQTWSLYFISGSEYWQDMCYNMNMPLTFTKGCLIYKGQITDRWNDLCFVSEQSCSGFPGT